jgi:hypothetical protein
VVRAAGRVPGTGRCLAGIGADDMLACVFARLLLWTDPRPLPASEDAGWAAYLLVLAPWEAAPGALAEVLGHGRGANAEQGWRGSRRAG